MRSKNCNLLPIKKVKGEDFYPLYNGRGYYVSMSGKMLNLNGEYKNCAVNPKGYYVASYINNQGKKVTTNLQRLIARTFKLNPKDKPQVHHIDHNTHNNSNNNLMYVTNQENIDYRKEFRKSIGRDYRTYQLSKKVVEDIYCDDSPYELIIKKHKDFHLTKQIIGNIKRGITHKEVTKNLDKPKTRYLRRSKAELDMGNTFRIWLKYINSELSLSQFDKELNLSKGTLNKRFTSLNLPVKDNQGRLNLYLTELHYLRRDEYFLKIWLNDYLHNENSLTFLEKKYGYTRKYLAKKFKELNLPTKSAENYFKVIIR